MFRKSDNFRIWKKRTGDLPISNIAIIDDNTFVTSQGTTLKIWDSEVGNCIQTLTGHTKRISKLIALQNGIIVSAAGQYKNLGQR